MTRQQCSRLRLDGVVPTDVCTRNWGTRGFTVIGPAGSVAMGGVLGGAGCVQVGLVAAGFGHGFIPPSQGEEMVSGAPSAISAALLAVAVPMKGICYAQATAEI